MFFESVFKGLNHWWRYLVVIVVAALGYIIGQLPLTFALLRSINSNPDLGLDDIQEFQSNPDFGIYGINSNMGFALLLVMFIGAFTALYFIFRPMHGRSFKTLITGAPKINWNKIFFGFGFWILLTLAFEMINYFIDPGNYTFQFQFKMFIPLLLISIFLLPVQTSLEEIFFRGYLMQGFGLLAKNKWVPLIITSILFGLVHSMNPEIRQFGYGTMQAYYISAGLFLGIITIMDDGLELALGVHAATNFAGSVFFGYEGAAIRTESLFTTQEINANLLTVVFLACAIVFVMTCKYLFNWGSFRQLIGPIAKPEEIV